MSRTVRAIVAALAVVAVVFLLAWWLGRPAPDAAPAASPAASASASPSPVRTPPKPSPPPTTGATTRPATSAPAILDPVTKLRWVDAADLPREASDTLRAIQAGPPYPYAKDGTVFNNAEGILPRKPRGYYHEFTVTTPGSADRGARRIVTGGPGEYFWTGDHYGSFQRIRT